MNTMSKPQLIKIKKTETGEAVMYFSGKYFAEFDSVAETENDAICKCKTITEMVRQARERETGRKPSISYIHAWLRSHGYEYQWKMLLEELRVQAKLEGADPDAFAKRNRYFNAELARDMIENYANDT